VAKGREKDEVGTSSGVVNGPRRARVTGSGKRARDLTDFDTHCQSGTVIPCGDTHWSIGLKEVRGHHWQGTEGCTFCKEGGENG